MCIACLLTTGTVSAASDGEWLDIEGQIQYGYYTEDLRALTNLTVRLDSKEGSDPLRAYYAALAYYRLALIVEERDGTRASDALEHCIASLTGVLQTRAEWAEVLALDGACLGSLAELKPLRAPLKHAVSAFEAARPGEEHVPEWGTAEGYAFWGRCELDRGEAVAARDALERALLIAPDFALARRLIARITAG